jgi:hypothetical protein
MDIRWHDVKVLFLIPFLILGPLLVTGVFLQAKAIVNQSKSFGGVALKMLSLLCLVAASVAVRANIAPYLIVFVVSLGLSLLCASLARKSLLR